MDSVCFVKIKLQSQVICQKATIKLPFNLCETGFVELPNEIHHHHLSQSVSNQPPRPAAQKDMQTRPSNLNRQTNRTDRRDIVLTGRTEKTEE